MSFELEPEVFHVYYCAVTTVCSNMHKPVLT